MLLSKQNKYKNYQSNSIINHNKSNNTTTNHELEMNSDFHLLDNLSDNEDEDLLVFNRRNLLKDSQRWSVLEKFDNRYRFDQKPSLHYLLHRITPKCLLASGMLILFLTMSIIFTRVIIFNLQLGVINYDYIVVGSGTTGSLVTYRLLKEGVILLN